MVDLVVLAEYNRLMIILCDHADKQEPLLPHTRLLIGSEPGDPLCRLLLAEEPGSPLHPLLLGLEAGVHRHPLLL